MVKKIFRCGNFNKEVCGTNYGCRITIDENENIIDRENTTPTLLNISCIFCADLDEFPPLWIRVYTKSNS